MNRFKTLTGSFALAAAALAPAVPTFAQSTMPASGADSSMAGKRVSVSSADRRFVTEAAKGGMAEVALGQLAQQKGSSDAVKQFGARMVEDHGKANDELKQLATSKNIMLPTGPSKDAMSKKLEGMSGSGFDRAYMSEMLTDHKKDIALFKKEASSKGGDPEIKAFATKTLPTLESHLQMVLDAQHAGPMSAAGEGTMKR